MPLDASNPLKLYDPLCRDAPPLVKRLARDAQAASQFRHSAHLFSGMKQDRRLPGFMHGLVYTISWQKLSSIGSL